MKQLFSDTEQLVFDHWLGRSRDVEPHDIDAVVQSLGVDPDVCSEVTPDAVVVARWLLKDITQDLPQYAFSRAEGEISFGRDHTWTSSLSHSVSVIPIHLFTINWADSAPGISWPESYHVCPIPGESILAVTASVDSRDAYGHTDFALGWFEADEGLVKGSGRVLRRWWKHAMDKWNQPPWAYLFDEGTLGERRAEAWKLRVWRHYSDW